MPASAISTAFASTGNSTKRGSTAWLSTANSAVAPPGGCRQRSANMAAMARPTAAALAQAVSGIHAAQATPTSAATVWLPTTDQGCASGLAGSA